MGAPSSAIFLTAFVRSFLSLFLTMGSCSTCDHATRHAKGEGVGQGGVCARGRVREEEGVPPEPAAVRLHRVDKQACHAQQGT